MKHIRVYILPKVTGIWWCWEILVGVVEVSKIGTIVFSIQSKS